MLKAGRCRYAILGIGSRQNERHREARTNRLLDGMKISALTIGVAVTSASMFAFYRRFQAYLNPTSSMVALHQAADSLLSERQDLAAAIVTMCAYHLITQQPTPLGAPMVAPQELAPLAKDLEALVGDLQEMFPQISTPDVWDLLICKAFSVLGGPSMIPLEGRAESLSPDMISFPLGPSIHSRDVKSLRSSLEAKGLTANEVVAIVGMYRGLGRRSYGGVVHQCSTKPFRIDKEYFENLATYKWRASASDSKWFSCKSDEKRSSQFKRMRHQNVTVSPNNNSSDDGNAIDRCALITMAAIDTCLLDDPMTEGWVTRFAENEVMFLSNVSDLMQKQRLNSLRRMSTAQ